MEWIGRVWLNFNEEKGMINFDDFSIIMAHFAKDRGIYNNSKSQNE